MGGGNDGGSFPHRSEMVKLKPKEVKFDKNLQTQAKSTLCTLSKAKL